LKTSSFSSSFSNLSKDKDEAELIHRAMVRGTPFLPGCAGNFFPSPAENITKPL
jgi:hypothetical protein